MTATEIATQLNQRAEEVARLLMPFGKLVGHEWQVGSVHGEAGKSCKICVNGSKQGIWCDFADSDKRGDMLDLWREIKGGSLGDTIKEVKQYLGIKDEEWKQHSGKTKPAPITLTASKVSGTDVHAWLNERGIGNDTIAQYRIRRENGAAVFPCYDGDDVVMVKYRKPNTKEIWSNKDPWPILFGWQAIPDGAREIIITEGEIDAMSFAEQGMPALSVPFGGGVGKKQAWIENEFDKLEIYDRIYLSMDMDKEGDAACEEIAERLGRTRCYVITLPRKDANDCLNAGIDLARLKLTAKTLDPKNLKNAKHFDEDVFAIFHGKQAEETIGIETPWKRFEGSFLLRPGEISIWTGINGHGKTNALTHLAVSGAAQGQRWCIASMETLPRNLLAIMHRQASGVLCPPPERFRTAAEWFSEWLWLFTKSGTNKAQEILDTFLYARKRYKIDQFIVDSLAKCGMAEDDYEKQKWFIDTLGDFARGNDCHVHLVAHARKGEDEAKAPGKMDIKGTGALTDMVDNVLSVWRNKPKEEKMREWEANPAAVKDVEKFRCKPDAYIELLKQRNADFEGAAALWYHVDSHQFIDQKGDRPRDYIRQITSD